LMSEGMVTGVVFVDLLAAYDTVNHRRLLSKILETTRDIRLIELTESMLENRHFFVELGGKKSRWRRFKNGLPQGSVLAPLLFNIYTNDQPKSADIRRFIYADDLGIVHGSLSLLFPCVSCFILVIIVLSRFGSHVLVFKSLSSPHVLPDRLLPPCERSSIFSGSPSCLCDFTCF
uniref:Reverse transcriptase domain-containing protein n=1 Tax=Seriola lalandi dorsalis TaxID=1841481 RepID=A0A3B4XXF1_SERLL